ncbi:MAG: KH domain-containing protein [bacterium]|nr:KH domain-containing protein [bacterium]
MARVISLLVDTPSEVQVDLRRERAVDLFRVRVDSEDLGQLIGRQGRTARALRTLLDVRGSRDDRRYGLEIREY